MNETRIIGIVLLDRLKEAGRTQQVLTKHADLIKTRLGFHELTKDVCSRRGVILLVLKGNKEKWDELEKDLGKIGGIRIRKMSFTDIHY